MTETLYISPSISTTFHYIKFGVNYYDLYNVGTLEANQDYNFYRVYYNFNQDAFEEKTIHTTSAETLSNINVSSSVWYRKDLDSILTVVFIICFFTIFCINVFSSIFRKGGVFSGLL